MTNLKADRPDRSNYLNCKNHSCKNASCWTATVGKLLTSPGIADMYTFLMNTWNTLLESNQYRVFKYTLATVKRHIQQVENPTPAMVISVDPVHVDNAILLDYVIFNVALQKPEIRHTAPNIPIDTHCTDDELQFCMPGGSGDYEVEVDKSDPCDSIPTTSWRSPAATVLERIDLGSSDIDGYEDKDGDDVDADEEAETSQVNNRSTQNVEDWGRSRFGLETSNDDGYQGEDGNDADADEEDETSEADDGSTQDVEDWGPSTRECEDWTVYFKPVKYDNCEPNTTESDVSKTKTVFGYVPTSQS